MANYRLDEFLDHERTHNTVKPFMSDINRAVAQDALMLEHPIPLIQYANRNPSVLPGCKLPPTNSTARKGTATKSYSSRRK
jgi:hypothetical protein